MSDQTSHSLSHFTLTAKDGPVFDVLNSDSASRWVLTCDHARNKMPECLGDLGLEASHFERHIGYDIGAEGVTRHLARILKAPAIIHGFCRLALDPNRMPYDPNIMPPIACDGIAVPGNQNLTIEAINARIRTLHHPYHSKIADILSVVRQRNELPLLLSVHSCTPVLNGPPRPWHIGVLWTQDERLAHPLIKALEEEGDLVVGDNQPYSLKVGRTCTTEVHGEATGTPYALIEIRQDLIETEMQQKSWAERLARIMTRLEKLPALHSR